jgi:hypothetical protein
VNIDIKTWLGNDKTVNFHDSEKLVEIIKTKKPTVVKLFRKIGQTKIQKP